MANDRYYTVKEVNQAKAERLIRRTLKPLIDLKHIDLLIFGRAVITADELNEIKNHLKNIQS